MDGFVRTVKQSRYLKIMFVVYILTLCFLGMQLVKISGGGTISKSIRKTFITRDNTNSNAPLRQAKFTNSTENVILELKRQYGDRVNTVSQCQITFPVERFRAQTWQKVGPTNSMIVYSAYHDERKGGRIQLMGLTVRGPRKHFCQLWYKASGPANVSMIVVHATIAMLHSDSRKFISCAINCPLPDGQVPFAVSIVTESDGCAQPSNLLEVRKILKQDYTRNFTVCVSPLNYRYGRAYEFVEWIELNRILGADYFIVYNHSSAVNIRAVLEYYGQLGIVEVVPWSLPIGVDQWPPKRTDPIEVHYFAQTSALNDCLSRSKGESKYIVNLDVDEFIIPHANDTTWLDLIGRLEPSGVYMFRNSFFRKEWNATSLEFPEKREAEKYRLVTLLKIEREDKFWQPKQRSKYIARTSAVEVIVTHDVTRLAPGHRIFAVPIEIGYLHHYRNWLQYKDPQKRVPDKTMINKFAKVLVNKVEKTWSMLKDVKLDIPIE